MAVVTTQTEQLWAPGEYPSASVTIPAGVSSAIIGLAATTWGFILDTEVGLRIERLNLVSGRFIPVRDFLLRPGARIDSGGLPQILLLVVAGEVYQIVLRVLGASLTLGAQVSW